MKAIYKRELRSYFNSMTGYIFIAVVIAFTGVYFMAVNLYGGYPYFSEALMSALSVFMFAIPVLTMRSLADERRSRTDQLLLTAPVSVSYTHLDVYKRQAMLWTKHEAPPHTKQSSGLAPQALSVLLSKTLTPNGSGAG